MIIIQHDRNQFYNTNIISSSISASFLPSSFLIQPLKKDKIQEVEIFELQTQAIHDLSKLLRLKTKQLNKYKYLLDHKSNFY